jgi:hypothetical protein
MLLLLSACKTLPEIPLTTPKPLEVSLNMRLDIYQYRGDEPLDKETAKGASEATRRMRNRMAEIQRSKTTSSSARIIAACCKSARCPPATGGPQMKKAVAADNEDRMLLMRQKAKESNRPLHEIESEQWPLHAQQANSGEWIEIPGTTSGSFQWKRAGEVEKPVPPVTSSPVTTPTPP